MDKKMLNKVICWVTFNKLVIMGHTLNYRLNRRYSFNLPTDSALFDPAENPAMAKLSPSLFLKCSAPAELFVSSQNFGSF